MDVQLPLLLIVIKPVKRLPPVELLSSRVPVTEVVPVLVKALVLKLSLLAATSPMIKPETIELAPRDVPEVLVLFIFKVV